MPRTGQPAFRLVGAVQRAFSVLDALAEADTELGTNEIARRTGINASSVSRLLATLVAGGLVEHVQDSGRYRLGLRLLQLGNVVLLAFGHRALPPGTLKAYTARTITQRAALGVELEGICGRGYAYNFGEREDDLHAIAAPVWGSRDELAAIIGVQGPSSRFDAEAMESAVRPLLEHTAELSSELGWSHVIEEVLQA